MINRSLNGRVCESFYAKDIILALQVLAKVSSLAELRFDLSHLRLEDIAILKKESNKKLIFTCRGGVFKDDKNEEAYLNAIESAYDYIDIDLEKDGHLLPSLLQALSHSSTQVILSYHNYKETPSSTELEQIIQKLSSSQADLIKIATMALSIEDVNRLMVCQLKNKNTICLGMGAHATESRIRSLKNGGFFTFVAYDVSKSTAQGQIDYKGFQKAYLEYRGGEDLKLAVIGNPISHSKSPELFEKFYQQDDIEGLYEKIELRNIAEFKSLKTHYDGFNVTSPFKQSIISYLDHLSPAANTIGAVNTVYQKDGQWIGENTDYLGISQSIEQALEFSQINACIILGAGGAARAAAFSMQKKGIKTSICNRTFAKANELAMEFSHQAIEEADISNFNLIINTIPEPFKLIHIQNLQSHHYILDAIYPQSPFETLKNSIGFNLIRGENWLKEQAKASYLLFKNSQ